MQSVNSQTLYYRAMICIRGTSHGTASDRLSKVGVLLKLIKFLLKSNRKSYALHRMVACPWPWVTPNRPKIPFSLFCTAIHCFVTGEPKKGKVFPYSLPSVGPRADPGEQAVSPQVTWSESRHIPSSSSSLPLLSARPAFTFVAFTRWRYL